ncbi:MAG: maltotransferase domain-containing protein, partial [Planctomycetota bacterium]
MAKTSSSKTSRKRAAQKAPAEGRHRVVIEAPTPVVDGGRYPAKRIIGDRVEVEADIFADGHDAIRAQILYRRGGQHSWRRAEMHPLINDRWRGEFVVDTLGTHEFIISAWIDRFGTWRTALLKKHEANQDVESHLHAGLELIDEAI